MKKPLSENDQKDPLELVRSVKVISDQYQLELFEIYDNLEKLKFITKKGKITREAFLKDIRFLIEKQKKTIKQPFEKYLDRKLPLVIKPNHPGYPMYLGLALAGYNPSLIERFLDTLKKSYKKEIFIDVVEYKSSKLLHQLNATGTKDRLDTIMAWVAKKREEVEFEKTPIPLLRWNKDEKELKLISKKLFSKKITENPLAFYTTIKTNASCIWKENDPKILVHFIFLLVDEEYLIPKKHSGYFQSVKKLFIGFEEKWFKNLDLAELSYQVNKFPQRHRKARKYAETLMLGLRPAPKK